MPLAGDREGAQASLASDREGAQAPLVQGELMAEVTPGKFIPLVSPVYMPRFVLSKMMPCLDGSYRMEPAHEWTGWVKLYNIQSDNNLPDLSAKTVRRLILAGFVDGLQPTPGMWLVKLDSLFDHLERTQLDDPDNTWWTKARRRAWSAAR